MSTAWNGPDPTRDLPLGADDLVPAGAPSALTIDLDAIEANVALLRAHSGQAEVMAVVKADGYGHGMVPSARAALAGGATWLGVAQLGEALELRAAGITAPALAWLSVPGDRYAEAVQQGVDLGVGGLGTLHEIAAAAREVGGTARVHLKLDTGLGRNGVRFERWPELVDAALKEQAEGLIEVVGAMSHYAISDAPADPSVQAQTAVFTEALAWAEAHGAHFTARHLANSAATLTNPAARFDLVRPGLAVYGLNPSPEVPAELAAALRPAMTWAARIAQVKEVPADTGVSYGLTYRTSEPTTLALVPLGYGDGVPRSASDTGPISLGGRRFTVAGRVCMDQFVVDVGTAAAADLDLRAGQVAVLFGDPATGVPSADAWAEAAGTISYEIVTRVGSRVPRRYRGRATAKETM